MNPEFFMKEALIEAQKALEIGEVPIGAVIERDGTIIGKGYNRIETLGDPTAHAEMIAIRQATSTIGSWRLSGCELYVTTEPCIMCAGAIVLSRLKKVYIGTMDPKAGACGSIINVLRDERLNHQTEIEKGILKQECQEIIQDFFKTLRQEKKMRKLIK